MNLPGRRNDESGVNQNGLFAAGKRHAMTDAPMIKTVAPPRRLGMIGCIVGLVAFIAAVLPHWIVPMIYPPPPADQVIVDTGHRIKDRLIARAKGVEYQAPKSEKSAGNNLSEMSAAAAVSLGLLAILFAVLSLIFREEKLLAAVAGGLGAGAIAVEISFFIIYALIAIAMLYVVANIIDLF